MPSKLATTVRAWRTRVLLNPVTSSDCNTPRCTFRSTFSRKRRSVENMSMSLAMVSTSFLAWVRVLAQLVRLRPRVESAPDTATIDAEIDKGSILIILTQRLNFYTTRAIYHAYLPINVFGRLQERPNTGGLHIHTRAGLLPHGTAQASPTRLLRTHAVRLRKLEGGWVWTRFAENDQGSSPASAIGLWLFWTPVHECGTLRFLNIQLLKPKALCRTLLAHFTTKDHTYKFLISTRSFLLQFFGALGRFLAPGVALHLSVARGGCLALKPKVLPLEHRVLTA
jgi:hypothetical protein